MAFRLVDDAPGFREVADPKIGQPEDLSFAERYIAPLLDKVGSAIESDPGVVGSTARMVTNSGNMRGGVVGGAMQGAADPGVAIAQIAAHAVGAGDTADQAVRDEEKQYQDARAGDGRSGFDLARLGGNGAMAALMAAASPVGLSKLGTLGKGVVGGAAQGALQPVEGDGNFLAEKAKQAGVGAATGGATSLLGSMLARVVSPNASVNPNVQLLRDEGVTPTVGQSLGGAANALEEKAQSLPIVGPAIQAARQRSADQLESAAFARSGDPIGATIAGRGNEGIAELSGKIGQEYDRVIPKLSVNVLDPQFVGRMSNLRSMVQALPQQEAQQFDGVISREIDGRLSPNGTLSGQNLKDAWNALRDTAKTFSGSNDAYQAQLGQAFKQAFQELKTHVSATNAAQDVSALKNADLSYANFKRLQRAASSVGADQGSFTPAGLQNAVKALDSSKDKARFAEGDALMQDLSSAGKSVLTNRVPDSGTAARVQLGVLGGLLTGGAAAPHIALPAAAGLGAGALAYTRPIQNALAALVAARPASAPLVANYLRRLVAPAPLGTVPLAEERYAR